MEVKFYFHGRKYMKKKQNTVADPDGTVKYIAFIFFITGRDGNTLVFFSGMLIILHPEPKCLRETDFFSFPQTFPYFLIPGEKASFLWGQNVYHPRVASALRHHFQINLRSIHTIYIYIYIS